MIRCPSCDQKVRTNRQSGVMRDHAVTKGSPVRCFGSFRRPSHVRTRMEEVRR